MCSEETLIVDGGTQLTEELSDFIWFRLALVLVPASEALGCSRPELVWVMRKILKDIRRDIEAHVSAYEVRRRREDDE